MGVIRDRIFAHYFGAGDILDAYYAAFRIPDLVYNLLVVGALSAGFIPIFLLLFAKDKEEAWRVTNSVMNILGLILLVICGLAFVFTPQLMPFIVPGFSGDKFAMTVTLTRIMFISPILLGISSVMSGVLQSLKSFFVYALTPIFYNLGIIIGAIFLVPVFGAVGLAYGVILGAFLHLLIQLPSLFHHGFHYGFEWKFKNIHVKKIGSLMLPRTLGLATTQLNLVAITVIASTIGAGSIAIFNFASNLQFFPVGIVGVSFAIAAFPTLSQFATEGRQEDMILHLSSAIRQILFLIIPCTILFLLLRAQIVRVVLGTGAFDWTATIATADALAFFSLSLFAQAITPLIARAFYALQDTWTPFLTSLVGVLTTIATSLLYKNQFGVLALSLGFSLGAIVQLVLLWISLHRRLGSLDESTIIKSLQKISIASIVMATVIQLLKSPLAHVVNMNTFFGIFTQGVTAGIIGLGVYLFICHLLRLDEFIFFQSSLQRRWLKLTNVEGQIDAPDEV